MLELVMYTTRANTSTQVSSASPVRIKCLCHAGKNHHEHHGSKGIIKRSSRSQPWPSSSYITIHHLSYIIAAIIIVHHHHESSFVIHPIYHHQSSSYIIIMNHHPSYIIVIITNHQLDQRRLHQHQGLHHKARLYLQHHQELIQAVTITEYHGSKVMIK